VLSATKKSIRASRVCPTKPGKRAWEKRKERAETGYSDSGHPEHRRKARTRPLGKSQRQRDEIELPSRPKREAHQERCQRPESKKNKGTVQKLGMHMSIKLDPGRGQQVSKSPNKGSPWRNDVETCFPLKPDVRGGKSVKMADENKQKIETASSNPKG